jgi:hypothetical protein
VINNFTCCHLACGAQRVAVDYLDAYPMPSRCFVDRSEGIIAATPVMLPAGFSGVIVNEMLFTESRRRELAASGLTTLAANLTWQLWAVLVFLACCQDALAAGPSSPLPSVS